jgi:uncharacterized membrane protein
VTLLRVTSPSCNWQIGFFRFLVFLVFPRRQNFDGAKTTFLSVRRKFKNNITVKTTLSCDTMSNNNCDTLKDRVEEGAVGGAAIGAGVGSVVPGVGTTVGAATGAAIGAGVQAVYNAWEVSGVKKTFCDWFD